MKRDLLTGLTFLIASLLLATCSEEVQKTTDDKVLVSSVDKRVGALPKFTSSPANNPSSVAKVKLGRLLFFDPILSGEKDVSCASCHHPSTGYAENRPLSLGVNASGLGSKRAFHEPNNVPSLKRNSQTILNTAFNGISMKASYNAATAPMFWDLRVHSLEKQALEPLKAFEEMRGRETEESEILDLIVDRLKAIPEYKKLFSEAFAEDEITAEKLSMAIASYERTLVTNNSRFDLYMRGEDSAISQSEKEGFILFKKSGCDNCHNGPMFSDYKIHVLGAPELVGDSIVDMGFENGFGFRTPSLRNLHVSGPYMHNGSMSSLLRVLEFYEDISGSRMRNPAVTRDMLDPLVDEIDISVKDMRPIISFLNCLNDNDYDKTIPARVPSGLKVGGN